jgi:hypothetical protein
LPWPSFTRKNKIREILEEFDKKGLFRVQESEISHITIPQLDSDR